MVFKPQTFHQAAPQAEVDDPTHAMLESLAAEALARTAALDASDVEVTVTGTTATLTGQVGSTAEKDMASRVIERIEGITSIDNRIGVSERLH